MNKINTINKPKLIRNINLWGAELGFQQIGFSDINLKNAEKKLKKWLDMKFHGEMHYMEKHGLKRSRPDLLLPNTLSVISARMNYLATDNESAKLLLDHKKKAYISRYTLGRDYHKVLRQRLKKLAHKIDIHVKEFGYRVFVDSAPVLEKPLANKAGLGWIGKHTNLINKDNGSWFFLGEIYTNIKLPNSNSSKDHCGTCRGAGVIEETKSLSVSIPAGVDNGDKVRLSGEGSAAKGGPAGDLYVAIQVIANDIFERDGRDLYFEAPIPFDIAILGGSINIPGLESKISLKVPAYTQTGKIFRIKGKGASSVRDSRRGDLMCRVVVETPVNLSNAQLKTFKEFAESIESKKHHPIKESFNQSADKFHKE